MFGNIDVKLTNENNKSFYYSKLKIKKEVEELRKIIESNPSLRKIDELRIMKSTEIFIEPSRRKDYFFTEGYLFNHQQINESSLKELHSVIEPSEKNYRTDNVFIINSSFQNMPTDMDKGISPELISSKMKELLDYINTPGEKNEINEFIKSCIMQFYYVYIHPFHDGNGRCARTLSKWYLLNHDAFYLSLVNRGILTNREDYKKQT